jgi:predicted glycoside hydrolase/deacetylase ChbG (UPF0249 family)
MTGELLLIVNADDFGQHECINAGVVSAFDHGIVTSASLMVRWPDAAAAVRLAESRPSLSLGLHFDLGEWHFRDGEWRAAYSVVDDGDGAQANDELSRQLGMFLRMTGRAPTHLDSHQNVHLHEPLRSQMMAVGERLGAPVRGLSRDIRYCGSFYGQWETGEPFAEGITVDALITLADGIGPGTTEVSCHPATAGLSLASMYVAERSVELRTLCDQRLPAALAERGVTLCSFASRSPETVTA